MDKLDKCYIWHVVTMAKLKLSLKDDILAQYGVPLVRFATNGSDEARILSGTLDEIMGTGVKKD